MRWLHRWAGLLKQQSSITVFIASKEKQTSVFRFRLQQQKFAGPFSVCRKQTEVAVFL
jgi:hypothetical protein